MRNSQRGGTHTRMHASPRTHARTHTHTHTHTHTYTHGPGRVIINAEWMISYEKDRLYGEDCPWSMKRWWLTVCASHPRLHTVKGPLDVLRIDQPIVYMIFIPIHKKKTHKARMIIWRRGFMLSKKSIFICTYLWLFKVWNKTGLICTMHEHLKLHYSIF